ncbi:MAG: AI-2E family transporter [Paludibacter sp.]|nr:AI-2E family transporter [Paludibacter sp.]
MTNSNTLPFYVKSGIFFVGLAALLTILYIAQGIIVPLIFAFIIAILLNPVVSFFVRLKINRIIAILITLLLTLMLIAAFFGLIYTQAVSFSDSWPVFVSKFTEILNQTISSIAQKINIRPSIIHAWITKSQHELINIDGTLIGRTIVTVGSSLATVFIVPVYIFVILYYKPILIEFIHLLFKKIHQDRVGDIVVQTKSVIQHYLSGLIIEAIIVGALNAIGLLLLGIEYAILLGVLGAVLNLVPYLGGIIAVGLFMMIALVTKDSAWFAVYVFGIHIFIQIIDNNYLVPKIVASRVKINALFSIIIVLVGNELWGISGMFLSIPLLAIVKVIFDNIDSLKPWGFLLGDTMPSMIKLKPFLKKNKSTS